MSLNVPLLDHAADSRPMEHEVDQLQVSLNPGLDLVLDRRLATRHEVVCHLEQLLRPLLPVG